MSLEPWYLGENHLIYPQRQAIVVSDIVGSDPTPFPSNFRIQFPNVVKKTSYSESCSEERNSWKVAACGKPQISIRVSEHSINSGVVVGAI